MTRKPSLSYMYASQFLREALNKTLQENQLYSTCMCVSFRNPKKGFARKPSRISRETLKKSHCHETGGSTFYVHVRHVMRERNPRKAMSMEPPLSDRYVRKPHPERSSKKHGARKPHPERSSKKHGARKPL